MRKGTVAARIKNQIPEQVKHQRSMELIALGREMTRNYESSFFKEPQNILVEETIEIDGTFYETGHNERYMKLYVKKGESENHGLIRMVEILEILEDGKIICRYI